MAKKMFLSLRGKIFIVKKTLNKLAEYNLKMFFLIVTFQLIARTFFIFPIRSASAAKNAFSFFCHPLPTDIKARKLLSKEKFWHHSGFDGSTYTNESEKSVMVMRDT